MTIGERVYKLRKEKGLSQEEVADKVNVSRQTVSKWETDQSMPDLDKIMPLCNLFNISANELLTGDIGFKSEGGKVVKSNYKTQKAIVISRSIIMYFLAIIWIALGMEVFSFNEGVMVSGFLLICAIPTAYLVRFFISHSVGEIITENKKEIKESYVEDRLLKIINSIVSTIFLIIYLVLSFLTGAWNITWILWIVMILTTNVIRLIFALRGERDEK